jgi:lipopolysaccharide heptosyltransferase II
VEGHAQMTAESAAGGADLRVRPLPGPHRLLPGTQHGRRPAQGRHIGRPLQSLSPVSVGKMLVRRAWTAVFIALVGACAAVHRLARSRTLHAWRLPSEAPRRILVLRFGLFGDGVLLTPTLRLLRGSFPHARIDVLATPIQVTAFRGVSCVDRVVVWRAGDLIEPRYGLRPANWLLAAACVRELRRERYDLALACYGPLSSAVALLCGAPVRVGFEGEAVPGTLTKALPGRRWQHPLHDAEYSVEVARAAGAKGATPASEIAVDEGAAKAVEARWLESSNGYDRRPRIVLHPGATNGDAKRWPVGHWEALAGRLLGDGHTVVLVGAGTEDGKLAARTAREARRQCPNGGRIVDMVNKTTLPELVALIDRADVFVSGDSGPMHAAVARRRPVVAIHGPTDPRVNGPFKAERVVVVRHPLPCSPCYRLGRVADCPLGHTLCQRLIEPETVYAAVRRLLDGAQAGGTAT